MTLLALFSPEDSNRLVLFFRVSSAGNDDDDDEDGPISDEGK